MLGQGKDKGLKSTNGMTTGRVLTQEEVDQIEQVLIKNVILTRMVEDARHVMVKHNNMALVNRWFQDFKAVTQGPSK